MTTTSLLIKRTVKSAASVTGARMGFPRALSGCVNIIAYHRVVKDIAKAERDAIYGIVISTATFRRHCEMLRNAFDVVSLETAAHFLDDKRRVARPMAVITFDDGYADFYDEAFPILNEFGLPATVFLPTAHIGQGRPLAHDRIFWLLKKGLQNPEVIIRALGEAAELHVAHQAIRGKKLLKATDELVFLPHASREKAITALENALGDGVGEYPTEYRAMAWDMVREMSRKGINFGSHTINHVVLTLENRDVIVKEINSSKKVLEEQIGKKVVSFAYPNGKHSIEVRRITEDAGFKVAVTTESRINLPGADLFSLGRTSLCEESTRGIGGLYAARVAAIRLGV